MGGINDTKDSSGNRDAEKVALLNIQHASDFQHRDLASGRWAELSLGAQMGNIGSEVSRALKWQARGKEKLMNGAIDRALELFDLTIEAWRGQAERLGELCRAREEFCDYFFGGNSWGTDARRMQRYYDQFISIR